MDPHNVVILRGTVSSAPVVRVLPSGDVVTNLDVTTRTGALTASVPVVVDGENSDVRVSSEVVVVGHVRRRFFRIGGATQSRTEVVASTLVPVRQRRRAQRTLATTVSVLSEALLD
ncbi:MAG: hypothetical protein ACO225_07825 [Ilumatobacteraceae bacterium]